MKTTEKEAIAKIRAALGLRRLNPRRLFFVDDGAYHWIGNRADLTADRAAKLAFAHLEGTRPDRITRADRDQADATWGDEWYTDTCGNCPALASSCGAGIVDIDDIPDDWQDGSALGPILPL